MIQNMPVSEAIGWAAVADLARLATAGMFALILYFIRGAFQDLKELRNDVHGKGGINERLAHVEGVQEANGA